MAEEGKRGFVFHTPDGEQELSIEEVRALADQGDQDGLYALGMAYLYVWDIGTDHPAIPMNDTIRDRMPTLDGGRAVRLRETTLLLSHLFLPL